MSEEEHNLAITPIVKSYFLNRLPTIERNNNYDNATQATVAQATMSSTAKRARNRKEVTTPLNVTATPQSGTQIQLTWTASTGMYVHGYQINANGTKVGESTETSFCVCLLDVATQYTLTVQGFNDYGGLSGLSEPVTATTIDTLAPTSPLGLTADAPYGQLVNLSWLPSDDNVGVVDYKIFRDGIEIGISTGTNFSDTTATESTTHIYRILARDATGNQSLLSTKKFITTPANLYRASDDLTPTFSDPTGSTLTVERDLTVEASPYGGTPMKATIINTIEVPRINGVNVLPRPRPLSLNQQYRISVFLKGDTPFDLSLFIIRNGYVAHSVISVSNAWTEHSFVFTTGETAFRPRLNFPKIMGINVYVDGLRIEAI